MFSIHLVPAFIKILQEINFSLAKGLDIITNFEA